MVEGFIVYAYRSSSKAEKEFKRGAHGRLVKEVLR
jgi:hypothetical protein